MKPIIAGNWKMNKTIDESILFINDVKNIVSDEDRSTIIFLPPFTSLFAISELLKKSALSLGAQNVHHEAMGAFTGEISINMLKSAVDMKVRKFVYSASSSVYGPTDNLPSKENDLPNPISPYANQKYYGELCCRMFSKVYGIETV